MEIECSFMCAYCFEENDTVVDGSGALYQQYVEDCQVCCKPNLLTISIDPERETATVTAEPE
jgi:Cysteine-rich CPXCG